MKKTITIWQYILILIFGFILNYKLIIDADNEFIFGGVIIGFIFFAFLLVLLWININDIKKYKITKSKLSYTPSILGLFVIISLVVTNSILKSRDNSPILIQAGFDGGYNATWFEFREDGTYKFVNSGGIGASYFRGKYKIYDSIIVLDKISIDNVIQTNRLLLKNEHNQDSTKSLMLYQVNEKQEIVDKEGAFTVNEDNRKNKH